MELNGTRDLPPQDVWLIARAGTTNRVRRLLNGRWWAIAACVVSEPAALSDRQFAAEVIQDFIVQPDSYSGLTGLKKNNCATFTLGEAVFAFHKPCSYSSRSRLVARHARISNSAYSP
jgi:hypothetical protein